MDMAAKEARCHLRMEDAVASNPRPSGLAKPLGDQRATVPPRLSFGYPWLVGPLPKDSS